MFKIFDINSKKLGDIILFCLYCVCFFGVGILFGIKKIWGDFDLSTISLVVVRGIDETFNPVIIWCVVGALVLGAIGVTFVLFWGFNKFEKKSDRVFSLKVMTWYLFLLFGGVIWFLRGDLDREIFFQLYLLVVCGYLVIQKREFVRSARWVMLFLFILGFVFWGNYKNDFKRLVVNYDDYFVEKTDDLVIKNKRNLIVVFAESFENRFSEIEFRGVKNRINDEDAVKFSYFWEGKLQGTTIEALSAAINGVHLGNEGKYFEYFLIKNQLNAGKIDDVKELVFKNRLGVGHILESNGYKNIFVKGASIKFMQTDGFLLKEGFDRENIYDTSEFAGWKEFSRKQKGNWWGPSDKEVFTKFKEKILEIDENKPFFAVMFTCDLHAEMGGLYKNPFFDSDEEIINATIDNINDFIDWFKKQEWSKNTSLVIIADHRKMGNHNRDKKEKLYNAFFNVPEDLKKNLNVDRRFNQVDMAPTLLELAGVKLQKRRYGVGVSLFSKEKTLIER